MIYVEVIDNIINEVTDQEILEFESCSVSTIDDAIDFFKERDWKYDDEIQEKLINIFPSEEDNILADFDIKVSTENRSFNELADMFKEGDIEIPDVQRKFVWDTNKCSKLIESILMGLPIPPLFFMDKGKDKYEIIDGLQRLTAVSNFILGNSWGNITNDVHRNRAAKLSKHVDDSISDLTFKDLSPEQQKKIKRSTVTVIDFRQINPIDDKAKYLIFERINTGSELLNPMQIRKALAYGAFMESLYKEANSNDDLVKFFGKKNIHKDRHVEFMLGVYVTYKVFKKKYELKSQYQKYILNDFCESNKSDIVSKEFSEKFAKKFRELITVFTDNNIFKKVNINGEYHGNRNNNIAESLIATAIIENLPITIETEEKYKEFVSENIEIFTVNKITSKLLSDRRVVCRKILGVSEN